MEEAKRASVAATARVRGGGLTAALERKIGLVLVLPAMVTVVAVSIFPLLYGLVISFQRWERSPQHPFIGFANYLAVLTSAEAWSSLINTIILVVVNVSLELILGMGLALLMVSAPAGRRYFLLIFMLPMMTLPLVVSFTWRLLFEATFGPINQVIGWIIGQEFTYSWLANTQTAYLALFIANLWQWTPFMFLILLAALSNVPPELMEAAAVDGAGPWRTFVSVTLPLISRLITIALLIRVIDSLKIFDLVYGMTGGAPGYSTQPLSYYIFREGQQFFRLGTGAAASFLFLILITFVISLFRTRLSADD